MLSANASSGSKLTGRRTGNSSEKTAHARRIGPGSDLQAEVVRRVLRREVGAVDDQVTACGKETVDLHDAEEFPGIAGQKLVFVRGVQYLPAAPGRQTRGPAAGVLLRLGDHGQQPQAGEDAPEGQHTFGHQQLLFGPQLDGDPQVQAVACVAGDERIEAIPHPGRELEPPQKSDRKFRHGPYRKSKTSEKKRAGWGLCRIPTDRDASARRRIRHMEPARISVYPASCRGRFSADACDVRIAPGAVEERKMEPKP